MPVVMYQDTLYELFMGSLVQQAKQGDAADMLQLLQPVTKPEELCSARVFSIHASPHVMAFDLYTAL